MINMLPHQCVYVLRVNVRRLGNGILQHGILCFKLLLACLQSLELRCSSFNLSFQIVCLGLQGITVTGY